MDIEKDIINRFIAESILKALTDNPADKSIADKQNHTEKIAWIEVYEDEVEEAYDMSKEVREYE
tara:strand:+ start:252 stop:443 length:192 start_codon:yes stop_codon:yes gene_type:complete